MKNCCFSFFKCLFFLDLEYPWKTDEKDLEIPARHVLDTFTSFSTDKNAAYEFAGKNGCIFKFKWNPEHFNGYIADVSWISKFPDEKEFLACRAFDIKIFRSKIKWEKMKDGKKVQIVPCEFF